MRLSPQVTTGSRETARPPDSGLPAVMTRAGIDPGLEGEDLQEALHRAIALRRCSCTWTQTRTGWVVALRYPEPRRFFGMTLEEALAWCLNWIIAADREHERTR